MFPKKKSAKSFAKKKMLDNKDVKTEQTDNEPKPKAKKTYNLLRGMHDILPKEERFWKKIYHLAESLAEYYQFGRIETPLLEESGLFVRSIGRGTDVIEKEMYSFEDRDGTKVALRPEHTASVARSYIGHGLWNSVQPVKLWKWGPVFRHDRPQAGRYRQFFQADFDSIGAKDPAIDAELILIGFALFKELGLSTVVRINSLGTPAERERYITELVGYYRNKRSYLCESCRARINKNPLRLLDCKESQCQPVKDEAPQILDWLEDGSKTFFMKVLEYLDDLDVPYVLTSSLVRGLDYYTDTVFEFYQADGSAGEGQEGVALGGGGRYDLLVETLGGQPTPGAGFSIGVERVVAALKEVESKEGKRIIPSRKTDVYFAQLGEKGKRRALVLMEKLRPAGFNFSFNLFKDSLKTQLESANNAGAPLVLILGQKEVQESTIIIRDMESGVQEIIDQSKLEATLKKKLGAV